MNAPAQTALDGRIKVKRVVHAIHAVSDLKAVREKYLDLMGGLIFAESYLEPEDRDMALLYVTDFMIEPMEPRDPERMEMPLARYIKRYGERLQSFEIAIDDGPGASEKLKAAGCRLAADYGDFFFVRAESTGGLLLEVTAVPMPNDPYDRGAWRPDWAAGHASTLVRLDHIACVVRDLDATLGFFTGHLDGELLSDARVSSPQPGRRAVVRLADTQVAFTQPDDPESGVLGAFLQPPTSCVYALVWRVEDEGKAEAFLRQAGVRTVREGCIASTFAIDPDDFFGARHEFVGAAG